MHTLYTRPETGGFAVHAALEQSGTEYKVVTIDKSKGDHRGAEFGALSPLGQVPVLKLPDGTAMTESAAMMIYLGDLNLEAGLGPPPGSALRPHYLRWLVFSAANLYMADLRYYYADRHTSDPAGIDGVKTSALADLTKQLEIVDQAIGDQPFLLGDTWSGADIYTAMIANWHPDVPALFAACRNLERMCNGVRELECVKTANRYHKSF
ncbi:MAG: glutathione S-transferase family protein [Rhizobiales bacterium]|nr:glutathione S-transferase family protein [Hyphomicrobiales bacterium]